jgi:hypothetical protein
MKLNGLDLVVTDVSAAVHLFESYFACTCLNTKRDNRIAILEGADGFSLVLMSAAMTNNKASEYPEAFQVGFMLERIDAVNNTWQQLSNGGMEVGRAPGKIRDTFGFYFNYQNIMIEVGCNTPVSEQA